MPASKIYCSFCGKAEHEVFYIAQGPAAGICDECVPLAADVIQDQRGRVARGEPLRPRFRTMAEMRCWMKGVSRDAGDCSMIGVRTTINSSKNYDFSLPLKEVIAMTKDPFAFGGHQEIMTEITAGGEVSNGLVLAKS